MPCDAMFSPHPHEKKQPGVTAWCDCLRGLGRWHWLLPGLLSPKGQSSTLPPNYAPGSSSPCFAYEASQALEGTRSRYIDTLRWASTPDRATL